MDGSVDGSVEGSVEGSVDGSVDGSVEGAVEGSVSDEGGTSDDWLVGTGSVDGVELGEGVSLQAPRIRAVLAKRTNRFFLFIFSFPRVSAISAKDRFSWA